MYPMRPPQTCEVRDQLPRQGVLRRDAMVTVNSTVDSCRRWRADAQAGGLLNTFTFGRPCGD